MARVRAGSTPETGSQPSPVAPASSAVATAGLPAPRARASGAAKKKRAVPSVELEAARAGGVLRQVLLIGGIAGSAFTTIALAAYDAQDPSLSVAGGGSTSNLVGPVGAYLADGLYQSFGLSAWTVLAVGAWLALRLAGQPSGGWIVRGAALAAFILSSAALELVLGGVVAWSFHPGGLLGLSTVTLLADQIGRVGAALAVATGLVATGTVLFRIDWQPVAERTVGTLRAGAPAAIRGVGALGVGAARASLRLGGAGFDALRDRAAPREELDGEEDEDEQDAASVAPSVVRVQPVADAPRRAPEVVAAPEARAPLVRARPQPPAERIPELPSVWSARPAPTPPPVGVASGDPDRDAPTHVAGRTLVEVEWEPTSAGVSASRAMPEHLRGAKPVPLTGTTPPRPARPVVHRVPDDLPMDAEPPSVAAVPWADEPAPLAWAERLSQPGLSREDRAADVDRASEPPAPSLVDLPERPAQVQPPAPRPPQVDVPVEQGIARAIIPPEFPRSGPALTAPTGRRPRPSGDGVSIVPGNLKSGGAGDDGRAVRGTKSAFQLPPLSLLDDHPAIVSGTDEAVLHDIARRLTETLREFQVDGRVTAIRPGPVITIYEYEPVAGVKLSRIANLADNLKMALKATSVRIVAPLPGKGCVGIEIPNEKRQTVWARDVFASPEFRNVERSLPMILGKDTEGRPFVTDLAKMPHLLVGGTTGSGKSVGVNSMLVSMLYMRTPDELRMILIDPKMLEFALYEDIPHLLHPVVTEPKFASAVLKWACTEMDERYRIMARWQTRHIDTYNQKVDKELEDWTPEKARSYAPKDWPEGELLPYPKRFPYIVIVIDELADLMMVASSDVEASISRIVAKARAAGIHLIVATQSPRRDVITGLIKANMPSSLAYQVRSALDSRVILDQNGAESLLGKGDLLFLRPGTSDLVRVHGPFLSEDEVHRVADFLRAQGTPEYDLRISGAAEGGDDDEPEVEHDELYDEAVEIAIQKGKISTSMLQRHLGIGYNRAANIVEIMEREGVVGPADGARAREVLVGQA